MAEQDLDRNEAATPHKLQKAREKGQAARSMEVATAATCAVAVAYLSWQGPQAAGELARLVRALLLQAAQGTAAPLWPLLEHGVTAALALLLPLMAAVMAATILATVAQTGAIFSLTPIEVDMDRIHPATGLRRIFSLRSLFEVARACIKLVVLSATAAWALRSLVPHFHAVSSLEPPAFLQRLVEDVASLGMKLALALAVIAAADLIYTRAEFQRQMRMSRRELKEEFRNREGDPRIRARLRELRRDMLKRAQALRNTRSADVVLTNPTHFAVALRYVHGEMAAPRVVAKGAGQLAAAMREIAARHRVVVVQNAPLARRLFREVDIDEELPRGFHAEVARIIVWVFAMRQQRLAPAGAPA